MKLTSYKFGIIQRTEKGGPIVKALIIFYEGDISTKDEFVDMEVKPVTRYRREKKLREVVYMSDDFGEISTDDELRDFLDDELAKDTKRTPVKEQDNKILNKPKR